MSIQIKIVTIALICLSVSSAHAALSFDRTRIIFNGADKRVSATVQNKNEKNPYLAQSWIEDERGNKNNLPFVVVPPLQRLNAGDVSQIRIESIANLVATLPQDRESVYYFNLREIPPKSDKKNAIQIALQTRIKLFYRPSDLVIEYGDVPYQNKLQVQPEGNEFIIKNPTPYYISVAGLVNTSSSNSSPERHKSFMLDPFGDIRVSKSIGPTFSLVYINDYGAGQSLSISCGQSDTQECHVLSADDKK
ncbi:TPA: molecular chaperone [Vibrio parahaemolyticus]